MEISHPALSHWPLTN